MHNLLVRPQGVLRLELLVTNLTRKVGFGLWPLLPLTFNVAFINDAYKMEQYDDDAKYACLARKTVAMISLLLVLV